MTLGIRQLAMFASKNKQVILIRIQVSHVEAVLEQYVFNLVIIFCLDSTDVAKYNYVIL